MKRLNFFPYYENLLRSRKKKTTFRLSDYSSFSTGEVVMLSVGWDEINVVDLHTALIKEIYTRRICDLKEKDFEGESQDCKSPEATKLVLSSIYRTVLTDESEIWVIKFNHVD